MDQIRWLDNPKPEPRCWDCGAANDPGSTECWLCQRRDWNRSPAARASRPTPAEPAYPSSMASLITAAAIGLLALALYPDNPGLAVALGAAVLPAVILTEVKARRRGRRGEPMSAVERILRVVALTIILPILLVVALIIAFLAICFFSGAMR